jgi:hypothetical protein
MMQDNYMSMLDSQIALAESTNDWNNGLTGVAGNLASVSKAMNKFQVDQLKATKAQAKIDQKYADDLKKFGKDKEKTQAIEDKYTKDTAKIKDQALQNELQGYSQLSGAMSQMFGESSREAAAFRVVQDGLALSAAVASIASAGMGDPYTAIPRVIAMTATMSSLLQNIGQTIGSSSISSSSDSFSAMAESTGTGTSFGIMSESSESIINSLDLMSDFAEPQYRAIVTMSNNITTLNSNIGKFVNQAITQGDTSSDFNNVSWASTSFDSLTNSIVNNVASTLLNTMTFGLADAILGGFGSSSTTRNLTDYGAKFNKQLITSAIEDIDSNAYQIIKTVTKSSSFWGLSSSTSTSYKTSYSDLDNTLNENMSMIIEDIYDSVIFASTAIGLDRLTTIEDLSDFMIDSAKISFNKSGDKIEDDFTSYISSISDLLSEDALNGILDTYRQVGEGLFETLSRVATEVTVVSQLLDTIDNMSIDKDSILGASQNLITLSGSLDEFSNITSTYYDSYFSDAEKLEDTTRMLGTIFNELGVIMPSTYEGFRNIVESLDLNTYAGQEAYIELMKISDAFRDIGDAAENYASNIKSWQDSFKTQEELASEMMSQFEKEGMILQDFWANSSYIKSGNSPHSWMYETGLVSEELATNMEELNAIYERMANDVDGLTDAELEALNANKALIDEQTSLIDNAVESFTNNMQSMADSIDSTIDSLRGYNMTSDELTEDEIKRINETQRAFESSLASGDSDKAKELLSEITALSSSIASGTFGDSSLITGNLITQLEANRALVDFEDTVLQVRIVADDTIETSTTTTTPSVYVSNQTDSTDTNYVITALLEQLLITNKNVLDTLEELNNKVV